MLPNPLCEAGLLLLIISYIDRVFHVQQVFHHQLDFQTSMLNGCLTEEEQKTLYKLMTKLQKHTEAKLEDEA